MPRDQGPSVEDDEQAEALRRDRSAVPAETAAAAMGGGWAPVTDGDYDLAGAAHDTAGGPPRRTYAICSSPRSGSTLLSEALTFLGAGVPIEYLDPTNAMRIAWDRWGCRTLDGYLDELHRRRTSRDGLFGTKLHWFQLTALANRLTATGGEPALPTVAQALTRIAPRPAIVRVVRLDRDRQALSWARAERTGRWANRHGDVRSPAVDVPSEDVRRLRRRLDREEAGWTQLLDHLGTQPLVVAYEQLCADYEGTITAVARRIGVTGDLVIPPPRLARQS